MAFITQIQAITSVWLVVTFIVAFNRDFTLFFFFLPNDPFGVIRMTTRSGVIHPKGVYETAKSRFSFLVSHASRLLYHLRWYTDHLRWSVKSRLFLRIARSQAFGLFSALITHPFGVCIYTRVCARVYIHVCESNFGQKTWVFSGNLRHDFVRETRFYRKKWPQKAYFR